MRISRGAVSDESDTTFSIIDVPPGLAIDTICPNGVHLEWGAVTGATSYEVYKLGTMYMEPIAVTTTTDYTITGLSTLNEDWLSVRALGTDGAKGRRAYAIKKATGLLHCIITASNSARVPVLRSSVAAGPSRSVRKASAVSC